MDKMIQSCPDKHIPNATKLLRDQFVECVGDGNLSRELRRIVREHPDYDLHFISCLLDTGSMVTTTTESFFAKHFETGGPEKLRTCHWLRYVQPAG